ncbi:MAG: site-specific DNA-methyltransferase, partial [Ginsengibacter sp.]
MEVASSVSKVQVLQKLKALVLKALHNGKLDMTQLKIMLGDDVLHQAERFELTWPGKSAALQIVHAPPNTFLNPIPEESINWDTTENIFIEGENLDALKILQGKYYGKIKTIYIDPPYNTGNNNFTYDDKFFQVPREHITHNNQKNNNGISIKERAAIHGNKYKGHLHANWLSMILPRLILARNLLRDDGLIFVSIDDNEIANLKLIMDEIFGANNYIEIFSWAKSETPANLSKKSKKVIEYILCYQKIKNSEKFKGIRKKSISS